MILNDIQFHGIGLLKKKVVLYEASDDIIIESLSQVSSSHSGLKPLKIVWIPFNGIYRITWQQKISNASYWARVQLKNIQSESDIFQTQSTSYVSFTVGIPLIMGPLELRGGVTASSSIFVSNFSVRGKISSEQYFEEIVSLI